MISVVCQFLAVVYRRFEYKCDLGLLFGTKRLSLENHPEQQ